MALATLAKPLNLLLRQASPYALPPLITLSRTFILNLLQNIQHGGLIIEEQDGTITICGAASKKAANGNGVNGSGVNGHGNGHHKSSASHHVQRTPQAKLVVYQGMFWLRLLLLADMGFADSYMLGEVDCDDLTAFFEVFIANKAALSNGATTFSSIAGSVAGFIRRTNTLANARLHISAHYDISNDMFAAFLSKDMTYSCAIWQPLSSKKAREESLYDAQMSKLHYVIAQAKIKPTDRVLEIGSGWGSFAIEAVKRTGCRVTSLTLSIEQKVLADQRIAKEGLSDRIDILLCDYRSLPIPVDGPYDKIVSIEMLESVGAEFLETYFTCMNRLLKKDGGIAVFQCITMPEARYEAYRTGEDFIRKYIFPGGHLPSVTQLVKNIEKGSAGTLVVDDIRNIGPHYAKTLRLWGESFEDAFEEKIKPLLMSEHKGMAEKDVSIFRRKWEYYFKYCEAGFRTKTLGDVVITVAREGALETQEDVPL